MAQTATPQPEQIPAREDPGAPPKLASATAVLPSLAAPSAAVPEAPAALKVSQGVVPGRLISQVDPLYPEIARRTLAKSDVLLHATVWEDGTVGNVRVVKGNAILVRAAIDAVRRWRYEPYRLNGKPVAVTVSIRLTFDPGR